MDNKQDRQFLSKVKNFINSSQSFNFSQKDDPLLNSIKNIVEKNQNTTKTKYQSHITNIESIDKEISTVKPSLFGIKNLNEYTQSEEEITRIRQERQASRERTRQRNAEENERLAAAKEAVKAKQAAAPQKTAAQKEDEQAEYMASRIAELSGKKPEELTSKEAGELSLMKSMTQGKVATRGLEGKIQGKLEAKAKVSPLAMEPTAGTDDTGRTQEQIDMEAMASGKPGPDDAAKRKAAAQGMMQRTIGRGQEELVGLTQTAIGRETEEKKAADAQYNQQMQARRLKEREGQLIQGTKMTYGDFKRQTGREYDATNREDSAMLVRAASNRSDFRVSPTARASDQTVVDFNRTYRDINAQNAAKEGELDRRLDQSKREYDETFETVTDPNKMVGPGIPWTASIPKSFIKRWREKYQNTDMFFDEKGLMRFKNPRDPKDPFAMRGISDAWMEEEKLREANRTKPTVQPARIGASSLSQAINSVLGKK